MVVGVVNVVPLNIGLQRCHLDHFMTFLDIRLWLDRRSEIWLLVMIWRSRGFVFQFWMVRLRLIWFRFIRIWMIWFWVIRWLWVIWFWLVDLSVERFWVISWFWVVGLWIISSFRVEGLWIWMIWFRLVGLIR